jgi:hypothetical protein
MLRSCSLDASHAEQHDNRRNYYSLKFGFYDFTSNSCGPFGRRTKSHACTRLSRERHRADKWTHYGLVGIRLEVRDYGGIWVETLADRANDLPAEIEARQ